MKRLITACGALLALALIGTSSASAATCQTTDIVRDGHPLTAAVYNSPSVTGEVDATGCDIGVATNHGNQTTVSDADIHGARYFGVYAGDANTQVTIDDSQIHQIGENPFNGAQHGVGVEWVDGATGHLDGSHVFDYQKNGVVVSGDGTAADVTGNDINGLGPVGFIAQNGVQYSYGASGSVDHNSITRNDYTGCSNRDAAKTGCVPYVAAGLLLYDVDPADVSRFRNLYRDDQRNELVVPSASL